MKLAIIVAAAKNGVIGINNQLPWHLPQDLKYFKSVTMGKPVIMGRKTYESIGRPLPGRVNIVVTRDKSWNASAELVVVHSLKAAVDAAENLIIAGSGIDEAIVIGGAEIYKEALPLVEKIYLTKVDVEPVGDAFFAPLDEQLWLLESSESGDTTAPVPYSFLVYRRSD
jgi:dihydrofolate reductase